MYQSKWYFWYCTLISMLASPLNANFMTISDRLIRELLLKGRLSTVDLLIRVGCFVQEVSNIFSMKSSFFKRVSTRRSTVLILPLQ
jgi:hypothetical protein